MAKTVLRVIIINLINYEIIDLEYIRLVILSYALMNPIIIIMDLIKENHFSNVHVHILKITENKTNNKLFSIQWIH